MMTEPTKPLSDEPAVCDPGCTPGCTPGETTADEMSPLAELQKQVEEKQQAYLRVLADFQNFQRRSRENEMRARDHGVSHVARAIIPVLEHVDLALGHDLRALPADTLADSVGLLRSELLKALNQCGIERIEPAVGAEFDPNFHEAVMQIPVDGVSGGHVAQCMQAGYRFGEVPLRSAKVAVTPKSDS